MSLRCAGSATTLRPLLALIVLLFVAGRLRGEEIDLQLRASWGGGDAASWAGSISISSGTLVLENVLGLEADAPGVVVPADESTLRIIPRTPRTYDGVDLLVRAPRDAVLRFHFVSTTNDASPARFDVPLEQLVAGRFTRELDAVGNRFAIHRTPGDLLRFSTDRPHLVYASGEKLQGTITPHLVGSAAGTTARCALRLVSAQTGAVAAQQEQDVALDEHGSAAGIDLDFVLPQEEGVYELVVELHSKRFSTPLVRAKPLAERQVQTVVVRNDRVEVEQRQWTIVGEFDPAQPKLWERMLRLPGMKMMPGLSQGPLGSEPTGAREHLGATWSTLRGDAWQAYPLPVAAPGDPHVLEVEFPSDIAQSLAISIVEPNAAGLVTPLGLDSGIDVAATPGRTGQRLSHRLAFWPRTKSPLVLLVNRRPDSPAVFGKIRVLAGSPTLSSTTTALQADEQSTGRLIAAYFDRPLFPENFSVSDALDVKSSRPIDDWAVFFQGGTRLADYLKFAGHNAAVVSVLCEGSALYPSQLLAATPKYDMGSFSAAGNDPQRKDVLEMLLRVFDRERLQFVPALQFCSPLPELEHLLATSKPRDMEGIELVGPDQQSYLAANPSRRGLAPYYNVLDPRVQQAMRRVVIEVAERYADHPSFTAIAIQLSGDGYAQLPDDACALDDVTLARFAAECGLRLPPDDARRPTARWEWIHHEAHEQWLRWRCEQVAAFYRDLRGDLAEIRPDLRLLLCPVDPLQSRRLANRVRPVLPPQDRVIEGLLQTGIDPGQLGQIEGLLLMRPRYAEPAALAGTDPLRAELNASAQLDRAIDSFAEPATLQISESLPLRLEAFDKVSPFGPQNTHMFLLSHLSPVDAEARKRFVHSMAASDAHWILDGGQMLSLGQEDAVRELLHTLRRIPAAPFETVAASADDARTQPVVLRRWSDERSTWLYLVNDSPWPVIADLDLATASSSLAGQRLGTENKPLVIPVSSGVARWKLRLEPYGLTAARFPGNIEVGSWRAQVDRAVDAALREQIREVRLRLNMLRSPEPLATLANESFEKTALVGQSVPHWTYAEGPGIAVQLDHRTSKRGGSSLHVISRSPGAGEPAPVVWVRSDTIPTPATGRLAIWVWLKLADPNRQPKLRLAIEGRLDGQPYYRRANVGGSEDGRETRPIQQEWSPFLFPLDDLPTSGLTNLQVGFDLMGEGEVWIDDVQVFDLWFQDFEHNSILKSILLADSQVQEGKVGDSLHFLESYWPQFLQRHVPLENARLATLPDRAGDATEPVSLPANAKPAKTPGMFDGMRRWAPRWPFQK